MDSEQLIQILLLYGVLLISLVFHEPGSPEGSLNDADDGLIPAINWSFPLSLELRSPEERKAAMHPEAQ